MIPALTASTIYSKLGNNSSLVPLAIKDIANSCGLTTASYMAGDKVEGKDRFIDEFGTQAIWLWGLPTYNKLLNLGIAKFAKLDPKIDARILKNKEILQAAQDFAPTQAIKESIANVAKSSAKYKSLTVAKFAVSTLLTTATYFGLTKFRHKYTENQIKKDYLARINQESSESNSSSEVSFSSAFLPVQKDNKKSVSFTGGVQDFIFDPVKNLMLVDASITGERLAHSRNPQDFLGYVIKEGSFWTFMYFAGPLISKALENKADKMGKSIDLDARVIFSETLKDAFKNGSIKSHLEEFKTKDISDIDIYKFAVSPKNENLIIDTAKKSDIIKMYDKTDFVDTRKFIDLSKLRGTASKIEKLFNQYTNSGENIDEFFKSVRKMKKAAILKNIGSCIGALGILAPTIMLVSRKFSPEYQVKKNIEDKLAKINN